MAMIVDVLSWVLLTVGGFFVLVGGIGALRMPDLYTRMHAASVTDSLGAMLILVALILQAGFTLAAVKLAATLIFLLFTCPTAANALASAALLAGINPGLATPSRQEPRS
ncbi:MAG: monovalent cation/H(+) antiporter subunit G [Kiloniellaceae bacterium]